MSRTKIRGLALPSFLCVGFFCSAQAQEATTEAGRGVGWQQAAPGPRLIQFGGVWQDRLGIPRGMPAPLRSRLGFLHTQGNPSHMLLFV